MNRLLFIIGSTLFTVSAVGFLLWGRTIVDTFDIMTYRPNVDPLPASTDRMWLIAISAFGLSTATVLCCVGLFLSKSKQSITLTGREFIVASALAIMISSIMGAGVCWWANLTFDKIARGSLPPEALSFDPVINQGGPMLLGSGGALVIAGIFLLLASIFGFRQTPTQSSTHVATLRWLLVAIPQVLLSLLFAVLFLLASFHGTAALELISDPAPIPDPSKLGSHVKGIYGQSQLSFILLFAIGLLWAAGAFNAPKAKV